MSLMSWLTQRKIKKDEKRAKTDVIEVFFVLDSEGRKFILNKTGLVPKEHIKNAVSTLDEAIEYIDTQIYISQESQYLKFCEDNSLDKSDVNNWYDYLETEVGKEHIQYLFDDYMVVDYKLNAKQVATILRENINYVNIGCSYEDDKLELTDLPEEKVEEPEDIFEYTDKKLK